MCHHLAVAQGKTLVFCQTSRKTFATCLCASFFLYQLLCSLSKIKWNIYQIIIFTITFHRISNCFFWTIYTFFALFHNFWHTLLNLQESVHYNVTVCLGCVSYPCHTERMRVCPLVLRTWLCNVSHRAYEVGEYVPLFYALGLILWAVGAERDTLVPLALGMTPPSRESDTGVVSHRGAKHRVCPLIPRTRHNPCHIEPMK